jgi:hypothetical protein
MHILFLPREWAPAVVAQEVRTLRGALGASLPMLGIDRICHL